MTITIERDGCRAHVGPSRQRRGDIAIFVEGPEPNMIATLFREVVGDMGRLDFEHGRPVLCDNGSWSILGRAWFT